MAAARDTAPDHGAIFGSATPCATRSKPAHRFAAAWRSPHAPQSRKVHLRSDPNIYDRPAGPRPATWITARGRSRWRRLRISRALANCARRIRSIAYRGRSVPPLRPGSIPVYCRAGIETVQPGWAKRVHPIARQHQRHGVATVHQRATAITGQGHGVQRIGPERGSDNTATAYLRPHSDIQLRNTVRHVEIQHKPRLGHRA
jgi:hypothetical protein